VKKNCLFAICMWAAMCYGISSQQFGMAQQSANNQASTFDVVSIKRVPPVSDRQGPVHKGCIYSVDRVTCQLSLLELIEEAYQVKEFETDGPQWLHDDVVFSFRATMPSGTTKEMARTMLQKAIADRFDLQLHREARPIRIYALIPGKQGLKLQAAADLEHRDKDMVPFTTSEGKKIRASVMMSPGRFYTTAMSLDFFAEYYLSVCAGIPVINMTGSTAEYKIDLQWMPAEGPTISDPKKDPEFLIAAEKQLGLQVEKRTVPHNICVIDHANRSPSED
jgi:uncharacterized protein (TIGR03435 family)